MLVNYFKMDAARDFSFELHNRWVKQLPEDYKQVVAGSLWITNVELTKEWQKDLDQSWVGEIFE